MFVRLAFGLMLVAALAMPAAGQDDLYTIQDIAAEGTGDTTTAAQVAAVRQAIRQAFNQLLSRLGDRADGIDSRSVSDSRIAGVVSNMQASNEQLGDGSYAGSITVTFNQTEVDALIDQLRPTDVVPEEEPEIVVPTAEPDVADDPEPETAPVPSRPATVRPSSPPALPTAPEPLPTVGETGPIGSGTLLVLPGLIEPSGPRLWDAPNPWLQAWQNFGGTGGATTIQVPLGGLGDVTSITAAAALADDQISLQNILDRYGAEQALVAVAQPTNFGLQINLSRIDPGAAPQVDRLGVGAVGSELYAIAVAEVAVWLDSNTGAISSTEYQPSDIQQVDPRVQQDAADRFYEGSGYVAPPTGASVMVLVPIRSQADWFSVQQQIRQTSGVTALELVSLTPSEAIVRVYSSAGTSGLADGLAANGLPTGLVGDGLQVIR